MTRHFRTLSDLGPGGLLRILDSADDFRNTRGQTKGPRPLEGLSVALVFDKASTRTRLSLEVAVSELGGHPVVLSAQGSQIGRGEPLDDTVRVLSRMVHAITFRTHAHDRLLQFADNSTVPVLNALTDYNHPMQILADLQVVRKVRGPLQALRYAWIGDGNNVSHSWLEAAGLLQLQLTVACPSGYEPNEEVVREAIERGAKLRVVRDPMEAARDADVLNTDVFTSMGQEQEQAERLEAFAGFRVTTQMLAAASPQAMVLHCLPAHRGEEIDAEVIDGPQSYVWDQAEARLHTSKALLAWALEADG